MYKLHKLKRVGIITSDYLTVIVSHRIHPLTNRARMLCRLRCD